MRRFSNSLRPSRTATRDGGEVVVGEHHPRRLLGDVGAGLAHRHADRRLLEGRGVVHSVAGHRDDLAPRLERPDDPQLVLGRDPGEDRDRADRRLQLRVVQRLDLAPR